MLSTNPPYLGPVVLVVALVVILLLCRWVFAPNHRPPAAPPDRGDFGLLLPVAVVRTVDDARMLRDLLRDAGIRGTVTESADGFAVLVFHDDAAQARALVRA